MKKIKLLVDHGEAKIGDVFIQGLFESPRYYKFTPRENWYWKEGSKIEDNSFLPASCFTEELQDDFEVLTP